MPNIDDILNVLEGLGVPDDWAPAESIESGGGTIPKTSSKGIVRASDNTIIELGPFGRIMAQYAMRDRAAMRAAATLGGLALNAAGAAIRGLEALRSKNVQTGRGFLQNKFVISGLTATKGSGRTIHISQGMAYLGGYQRYFPSTFLIVPNNGTTQDAIYTVYVSSDGVIQLGTPPESHLPLARITVPAGDTGSTFSGTVTDLRVFGNPTLPPIPTVGIQFGTPMPTTAYVVLLYLESSTDPGRVQLQVTSKARNGFTVALYGGGDDVTFRWLAYYPWPF